MTVRASDLPIGFELPPFTRRITREMAQVHGAPLKNFHTVLEEARRMGYPDLVVAGPMFVCFFSEMFTRFYGERWLTGGSLEFKLTRPVLAGQTIAAWAVVTSKKPEGNLARVAMDIWCERQEDGAKTSVGKASVAVEA